MRGKPLLFKTLSNGCIIPCSHKLNKDGYFRYTFPNPKGKGRGIHKFYHIHVWEEKHGKVPDGYSIHHKCGNRACCNPEHLMLMEKAAHARLHNSERYKDRMNEARAYWEKTSCSGSFLAKRFNVSVSNACKWIRGWKV